MAIEYRPHGPTLGRPTVTADERGKMAAGWALEIDRSDGEERRTWLPPAESRTATRATSTPRASAPARPSGHRNRRPLTGAEIDRRLDAIDAAEVAELRRWLQRSGLGVS